MHIDQPMNYDSGAGLTDMAVADTGDISWTSAGYGEGGYPYFGCTLYFDPFLSTSW